MTTTGQSKKFEYDGNGNLRYEKLPNNTVVREYRWDQQNRLVRFLQGTHESVYEYDGESHRVRIKELTSSVETKNETFVWCGSGVASRICQKRASNGSIVLRSYFSEGFEEGSSDYFYTGDHLGSVREVVASNGTTVASRASYGPWGKPNETGTVLPDFWYTGHYADRPSGLGLTWFRGYDANLGRWLSRDPIGFRGGLNLYGYVNNSPANFIDPTGEYAILGPAIITLLYLTLFDTGFAVGMCVGSDDPDPPEKSGRLCPWVAMEWGTNACIYQCPSGMVTVPNTSRNDNACAPFITEPM